MKLKHFILLSYILLALCGCSRVYAPAMYHQDIAYQPKPTSFDAAKTATYISAGLNNYSNINFNDLLTSGQVNLSVGQRFDNFNMAYGGFGVLGNYQYLGSASDKNYFTDKFFGAIGGRFSANAFVTSDNVDFRFIGVEMVYSHEFGDYANYRQQLLHHGGYFVDPRTNLYTIGLTTEVIFNVSDLVFQHGIRGFLGTTLGHNNLNDSFYTDQVLINRFFTNFFPKASYFATYKNFFVTAEIGGNLFFRFGYKF